MLNSKNDLIGFNIVSVGSLSPTTVHPREVLKPAILANSASIIMCHNHPSGDPQPSEEDRLLTRTIVQAADIIGIRVLEHLIITMDNDRYFSFADQGSIARTYAQRSGQKASPTRSSITYCPKTNPATIWPLNIESGFYPFL
jgi:DNA repair protein RadC